MDLESFFDRVNHDRLMARLKSRTTDATVLRLIHRFLKAGVIIDGKQHATMMGVPQGGPLSPVMPTTARFWSEADARVSE